MEGIYFKTLCYTYNNKIPKKQYLSVMGPIRNWELMSWCVFFLRAHVLSLSLENVLSIDGHKFNARLIFMMHKMAVVDRHT